MSDQPKSTNVQVAIRCRPTTLDEKQSGLPVVVNCDPENKAVKVAYGPIGKKICKTFTFDKVFGTYSTQEEVFESIVRPIVDEVLAGFNCTIFAYGQTGTGKTYTMEGDVNSEDNAGIVPRSVKAILENLSDSGIDFTIRVSFLELYNEELQDLLADGSERDKKLRLCEDLKKGVICQNLQEVTVLTAPDIFHILKSGIELRQTAATLLNKNSSRSHSIFTMKIMIKESNAEGEEVIRLGQLNLVDLAGSECIGRSGAKNVRAREAGSINQSLLTLGRVITALVDHHTHIPYRDSKLTRLLQESLGGKAKTCIIATLSPSQICAEETLSTLDYAYRAKSIKNLPVVNERTTKRVLMKEYSVEIEHLRTMLQLTREKNGVYVDPTTFDEMEQRIVAQEAQILECEAVLKTRTEELKLAKAVKEELEDSLEETQRQLHDTEAALEDTRDELARVMEDLQLTRREMAAAEAVIAEQRQSEVRLLKQANEIKTEALERRCDVSLLVDKVASHEGNDANRTARAWEFLNDLEASRADLLRGVEGMLGTNSEHSAGLVQDIDETIDHGKVTCDKLRDSLEQALRSMDSDVEKAKSGVSSMCGDLSARMEADATQNKAFLEGLRGQLSGWMMELQETLAKSKSCMQTQHSQLTNLVGSLTDKSHQYAEMSATIASHQRQLEREAALAQEELHAKLKATMADHQSQLEQQAHAAMAAAVLRKESLEKAIGSLLVKALNAETESLTVALASSQTSLTVVAEAADLCESERERSTKALSASAAEGATSLQYFVVDTTAKHTQATQDTEATRLLTSQCLDGATAGLAAQQSSVRLVVSTQLASLEDEKKKGQEAVNLAVENSIKKLDDAKDSSLRASGVLGQETDSYAEFLASKAGSLKSKLMGHFDLLSGFLRTQQNSLEKVGADSQTYGSSVSTSAVQKSGSTPAKTKYEPLPDIVGCRSLEEIKAEALRKSVVPCDLFGSAVGAKENRNSLAGLRFGRENLAPQINGKLTVE